MRAAFSASATGLGQQRVSGGGLDGLGSARAGWPR